MTVEVNIVINDLSGFQGYNIKQTEFQDLFGITDNDPTDGQRRLPIVIPDRCFGSDLNRSFFLSIPLLDRNAFPTSVS